MPETVINIKMIKDQYQSVSFINVVTCKTHNQEFPPLLLQNSCCLGSHKSVCNLPDRDYQFSMFMRECFMIKENYSWHQ